MHVIFGGSVQKLSHTSYRIGDSNGEICGEGGEEEGCGEAQGEQVQGSAQEDFLIPI